MESDGGLVREIMAWHQRQQQMQQEGQPPTPTSSLDIHTLMALAPLASRRGELLPPVFSAPWRDPALHSLREKGRVDHAGGGGSGGSSGGFFSAAWAFRTVTGACMSVMGATLRVLCLSVRNPHG